MNRPFDINKEYAEKTLQEARDSYHKIISAYDKSGYSKSYAPSHIWNDKSDNMRDLSGIIGSGGDALSSVRKLQSNYMYAINPSGTVKTRLVEWYLDYLKRRGHDIFKMDASIQESPVANPDVCVEIAGRRLTPDFLMKVCYYFEIQKYCGITKSKFRIVELGGGYGCLARTLKLFIPNSIYVDIDLPESLYFAYLFLKLSFPEARILYVTDQAQLKDGLDKYDFVLIPTMFAESITGNEFDLFCNTASLGEMTNPLIRYWMDFVQNKLKVKYFFGNNRYLNALLPYVSLKKWRIDENECSVLFDARWKILAWELDPEFNRCPYEEPSNIVQYLAVVAERLPAGAVSESDNKANSRHLIEGLLDEDWIRSHTLYVNSMMRNPLRVYDFKMSGTLFKLWESIRLHPDRVNVSMMLMYMSTMTKGAGPFEEWSYYKKLLRGLPSAQDDIKYEKVLREAAGLKGHTNPLNMRALYYAGLGLLPYQARLPVMNLVEKIHS